MSLKVPCGASPFVPRAESLSLSEERRVPRSWGLAHPRGWSPLPLQCRCSVPEWGVAAGRPGGRESAPRPAWVTPGTRCCPRRHRRPLLSGVDKPGSGDVQRPPLECLPRRGEGRGGAQALKGPARSRPQRPRTPVGALFQPLCWGPHAASTVPSRPGPGWPPVPTEETLQKTVSQS